MIIIREKAALIEAVKKAKSEGLSIGFVPTMGGLHAGHLSLIDRCKAETDFCIASVFLNPTQFNDKNDLITYPHDPVQDESLLQLAGVDVMFAPSVEEMYDAGETAPKFNIGRVAEVMEGAHRPGHFEGVVWVVSKLFRLLTPDKAFFGEKDFQQIAVIRRMTEVSEDMNQIEIVPCPVIRESDGLAMSSRNNRLSLEQRSAAPEIFEALQAGVDAYKSGAGISEVHKLVVDLIDQHPLLKVEYFSIVDGHTLEDVKNWDDADDVVGCITVFCGDVRLIDHIRFISKE
ncbi:pantoate--beta-alanine ligase [Porphyromonas sp.]|uniref:pantoate--beta-alanine ligase n=1 Tax=Porphyromonas sp. TaxID=1924944 RepID=UPI0026DDB745|nr:pantoate--beta-alanine ligase [Porphyromonas sp.]MDO4695169.1 pantoate--beta-alanine ligase [Porphyromonas sp.]MDO4770915.1 pantoate--beta-alanine ligase [Porphyromonas sp.]